MTKYYSAQSGRVYRLTSYDELAHHGILGQKWGVRRFQNADRTWTEEGKIRYGKKSSDKGRLNGKTVKVDVHQNNITDHNKKGSNADAVGYGAKIALDLVSLNPVGLAVDLVRGGQALSAKAKENAAAKRLADLETDKESGLKLKDHETTPEEDMKLTNPGYHNFNSNTKNNCVLCSTAFELRRRGYDVIAEKAGVGYQPEDYIKWFKGATFNFHSDDHAGGEMPLYPNRKKSQELLAYAKDNILSQGEGARGYFSAYWSPYAGHSMAYEVKNGNVVIYDAQCGKKWPIEKITKMSVDVGYTRLDDKEPNWAAMKAAGVI
ncbi:MAG: hypothetical protein J6Y02_11935 [Pseudobutyrivibrio sp.]|nr:hypothetical protein [Pseudobutyrivibrio sp.]